MKAIVIFYEGECAQKSEANMISEIGSSLLQNTTANHDQIQIHVFDEVDLNKMVVNGCFEKVKKAEKDPMIDYCQLIIKEVGSPALSNKETYRIAFLKKLQNCEKLRNKEMLRRIRSNGIATSKILQTYGLQDLSTHIADINAILRIYGYGEI